MSQPKRPKPSTSSTNITGGPRIATAQKQKSANELTKPNKEVAPTSGYVLRSSGRIPRPLTTSSTFPTRKQRQTKLAEAKSKPNSSVEIANEVLNGESTNAATGAGNKEQAIALENDHDNSIEIVYETEPKTNQIQSTRSSSNRKNVGLNHGTLLLPATALCPQPSTSKMRPATSPFTVNAPKVHPIPNELLFSFPSSPATSSIANSQNPEASKTTLWNGINEPRSSALATNHQQLLNNNDSKAGNKNPQDQKMDEKFEIMLTYEACSCCWCGENLGIGDGVVLQACLHQFCRNCLVMTIKSSDSTEIKCPMNGHCGGNIYDSEIRALIKPEEYDALDLKSMQRIKDMMPNTYTCKTPNCSGWCEFEKDSKVFLCPVCNKRNCISCKAIHDGIECDEFQRLIQEAVASGKSNEEAHKFAMSHVTDGFEQLIGTVNGWMLDASMNARHSSQYTQVLQRMACQELWISNKEFECPVCFDTVPIGGGVIFECMHSFCKVCAIGVVEHATDPEVKCPFQDGNYSCMYILKEREIRALVSPELYQAHLARSVKLAENAMSNTFHCKTPDCTGWCEFEPGAQFFFCLICSKKNCLECKVIHENVTCEDYKNRLVQNTNDVKSTEAVEKMISDGQCMRCSKCQVPVQKIAGCDWLQCSVCKTELCWVTKGPRWGPNGNGDTSGGCGCRIGGKKCHPKCGNCH